MVQKRGQFILKGDKTIRALTQVMAVYPNLAVFINAIKINVNLLARPGFWCGECFFIPAYPARQITRSACPFFTKSAVYAPLVWQLYVFPIYIGRTAGVPISNITLVKKPVAVKQNRCARPVLCLQQNW